MRFFAGIDLGKRKSQIRVITEERKRVEELKIDNDPKEFRRVFQKYGKKIEGACEATSNAFWVADTLEPIVGKVHVGDTKKIRWIAEARIKTDKIDAGILAELLRADLFPRISIPPRRIRDLRELVRGLVRMRRQITRCRNQVHGLLGRQGIAYQRANVLGPKLGDLVKESMLPDPARVAAEALLRVQEAVLKEEKVLEKALREQLVSEPELRRHIGLLETIPGVGLFSAMSFVLELWDIGRFRDDDHLASYIGLVPSTHQTGETMWNGPMTRQGNILVRWVLVQDAWAAVRSHWFFGRLYERFKAKKGKARAIVPVARKLLNTIYRVWTEGKSYEEIYGKKVLAG